MRPISESVGDTGGVKSMDMNERHNGGHFGISLKEFGNTRNKLSSNYTKCKELLQYDFREHIYYFLQNNIRR